MNHYALAAARERRANTVLAFVGGQHRLELEQYFRANGYVIRNPTSVVSEPSSTQEPAPESVLSAWKAGIQRLREAAAKSTPEWKQRLMSKIRYFEVAVEQKGRCCVSDDALKP
jgi:hypothetical protein